MKKLNDMQDIIIEPRFKLDEKEMTLDYISEDDFKSLSNTFTNIDTKQKNYKDIQSVESNLTQQIKELSNSMQVNNKKLINTQEFAKIYSIPVKKQGELRGRHKDPLPFIQTADNGNILYDVKIVDKWTENYMKNMS